MKRGGFPSPAVTASSVGVGATASTAAVPTPLTQRARAGALVLPPVRSRELHEFPRLQSYFDSLPHGFTSFSDCLVKASMIDMALQGTDTTVLPASAPRFIRSIVEHRPPSNHWIPEIHHIFLNLYLADTKKFDQAQFRDFWRRSFALALDAPMYGLLFRFLSLRMVTRGVTSRWTAFRKGTSCHAEPVDDVLALAVRFPRGLYPEFLLHGVAGAFEAVAAASDLFDGAVEFAGASDVEARYRARLAR